MRNATCCRRGFTLNELLAVAAGVIVLLAGLAAGVRMHTQAPLRRVEQFRWSGACPASQATCHRRTHSSTAK